MLLRLIRLLYYRLAKQGRLQLLKAVECITRSEQDVLIMKGFVSCHDRHDMAPETQKDLQLYNFKCVSDTNATYFIGATPTNVVTAIGVRDLIDYGD